MSTNQMVSVESDDVTGHTATGGIRPGTPGLRLRVLLVALLAALLAGVGLAGPAAAASQTQPGNCNNNYAVNPTAYSLVVRSPKIWSNNGTSQSVRYRSLLDKWNGSAWAGKETGQWRQGTATPNTAWQGASGTWSLNPHGGGYYSVRVQVQYLSNGVWGGTTTARVGSYHQNNNSGSGWTVAGVVGYCTTY